MSENKFTQGEWKVKKEFDNHYFGSITVFTEDMGNVCQMTDNWSIWNSDRNTNAAAEAQQEAEANAKIIAASKDLLEALIESQKFLVEKINGTPTGNVRNKMTDLNILIEAAIQKATL